MEACIISSSSHHHSSPFPANSPRRHVGPQLPTKPRRARVSASKRDTYGGHFGGSGGLVDENMIVLRKRIHEMKVAERNYEPPADWMEWEKQYHTEYDSDVCEILGLLQALLINTRPSFAIGAAALVAFSVPTSAVLILGRLIEASKPILSTISLN